MNYIIFDLEWNQSPSGKGQENKDLPFEIIEIGAVKLDDSFNVTGRFHEIVAPVVYNELHYITRDLIMLSMEDLKKGKPFKQVAEDFLKWCEEGGEYIFGTWGSMDLTELQRNCKYFNIEYNFPKPFIYYDIQKLYSRCFSDGKQRVSLETAVTEQMLEKDIPFHSAFDDAIYTARILQKINFEKVRVYSSVDTFIIPKNRKEEFTLNYGEYTKYVSRGFADKDDALKDGVVLSTPCVECGKNCRKKIRWFATNQKMYYCLAYCDAHGLMKGKLKIRKTTDEKCYVVRIIKAASREDAAAIKQKQVQERIKRRKRRQREKQSDV